MTPSRFSPRGRLWISAVLAPLAFLATRDAVAVSIITEWNPVVIEAAIADTPAPTPSTRMMAIVFTCAYEAWAAYDPVALGFVTGDALDGTGGDPTEANKNEAISHAMYGALVLLAPSHRAEYDAFLAERGWDPSDTTPPAVLGRAAAQAVLDSRADDGSNWQNKYADTTSYKPRAATAPDAWQPLDVLGKTQTALTPHWGNVTPFALARGDQFRPPPPARPGTLEWDTQIQQMIAFSAGLTTRQKAIAEFWRPQRGTPPMILAENTAVVSQIRGFGLDDDARLFFTIHNAMFDAGIAVWEAKYHYDYVRPITAVRNLGNIPIQAWGGPGRPTETILASQWNPYQSVEQPTPPFPEYVSGHSGFSAAWAEIMKSYMGSDDFGYSVSVNRLNFENIDLAEPVVLTWPTFTSAAEEAGISRLYGGIHFMDGNLNALRLGRQVGAVAWDKAARYFDGTASPASATLANLTPRYWETALAPPLIAPEFFSDDGLGLFSTAASSSNVFGFWQSKTLDPIAAGSYRMRFHLVPVAGGASTRLPEIRARVFRADNTVSALCVVAQTSLQQAAPEIMDVLWESDGRSPFRVAFDLLDFGASLQGGVVLVAIDNQRVRN